jgi:hypothetical protein
MPDKAGEQLVELVALVRESTQSLTVEQQGERYNALTCGFGARGRIRTDDLPITSRSLTFQPDPLRTIPAAQERDPFLLMPSRTAWYQRLGCQRGCHPVQRWQQLACLG